MSNSGWHPKEAYDKQKFQLLYREVSCIGCGYLIRRVKNHENLGSMKITWCSRCNNLQPTRLVRILIERKENA